MMKTFSRKPKHQDYLEHRSYKINTVIFLVGTTMVAAGLFYIRSDFTLNATGIVERESQRPVFSPRGGLVQEVHVREGDYVDNDALLLTLDGKDLRQEMLARKRELANLRANLQNTQLTLDNLEIQPGTMELLMADEKLALLSEIAAIQEEVVTQYEKLDEQRAVRGVDLQNQRIEQVRTRMQQLEAQRLKQLREAGALELERERLELTLAHQSNAISLIEEEIRLLEREQQRLEIRAPIAGNVLNLEFSYADMDVNEGDFICEISDPDSPFAVVAMVGEKNIDLLAPGTPVRMESKVFQSSIEGYIQGRVTEVAATAENSSEDLPFYEVEVLVEETPYPLVLGSRLQTEFVLGQRTLLDVIISAMSGEKTRPRQEEVPNE